MVTLACNLDILGPRFFTGLTAIFIVRLRRAPAWQVAAFSLLCCCHHGSPPLNVAAKTWVIARALLLLCSAPGNMSAL
jgi:hypothetical protein